MGRKTPVITYILFAATLVAILASSWATARWPSQNLWVIGGLSLFVVLLLLATFVGLRRTT
jgi:hypothetical protein